MMQGLGYVFNSVAVTAFNSGLYVSLCTIQQPSGNFGPSGAPDGTYTNVSGRVNLACQRAAPAALAVTANEVKSVGQVESVLADHVAFPAYYPDLETAAGKGWRAIIDSVVYDILGAECDSQKVLTRMEVQVATV